MKCKDYPLTKLRKQPKKINNKLGKHIYIFYHKEEFTA